MTRDSSVAIGASNQEAVPATLHNTPKSSASILQDLKATKRTGEEKVQTTYCSVFGHITAWYM